MCIRDRNASVPLPFCSVIVLSAVGSVTCKVVSYASSVVPSNTIAPSLICKPVTLGAVRVLLVKVCVAVNNAIAFVLDKSVEAIVMFALPSND